MNILIVEDNLHEQVIIKEAFKAAGVQCDLHMVKDGFEALAFLKKEGDFKNSPKPELIILDLNLPGKKGHEVLIEIKNNFEWEHIPVLVFSNSESPKDVCRCYSLHVNAYINKPAKFEDFVDLARTIDIFWFKLVRRCSH
jgi:chemotaxis family two-component system response regulator Rcp1